MAAAGLALSANAQQSITIASVDQELASDYAAGLEIDLDNDGIKELIFSGQPNSEVAGKTKLLDLEENEYEVDRIAWKLKWNGTAYDKTKLANQTDPARKDMLFGIRGTLIPADFNGDGNVDVFIAAEGYDYTGVYLNDGQGNLTKDPNYKVLDQDGNEVEWYPRSVDVADFNADGLPDVVTIGWSAVNQNRQANVGVLINKGNGSFQNQLEKGLVGNGDGDYEFALCTVKAYDLNNDGLADFMIQGNIDNRKQNGVDEKQNPVYVDDDAFHPQTAQGKKVNRTFAVYMNMSEDGEVAFYDMELAVGASHHFGNGNFAVADFNNDGTPDLFVTGESPDDAVAGWAYFPQLLIGKITAGELSYTDNTNFVARGKDVRPLNSTNTGVRAIDYNGDGLYDLFLLGWCEQMLDGSLIEEGEHKGEPLKTQAGWFLPGSANGLTSYQRIPGASEQGIFFLDNGVEGALNYTFTGYHGDASYFPGGEGGFPGGRSMVFTKNPWEKAARPAAPTALDAQVEDNTVALSWTPAATAQKNVTYEYFIKDASGKIYNGATSFIGGDKDGVRKVLREGNAFMNTNLALNNIPAGEYTWGVQTVAADLQGSTFATGTFTVTKQLDGISNMNQKAAVANIFTIDGKRVAAAQKGLNIVKMSNGEVRKVMK